MTNCRLFKLTCKHSITGYLLLLTTAICLSFFPLLSTASAMHVVDHTQPNSPWLTTYQNATFQVSYRSPDDPGDCLPDAGTIQAWPADAQAAMNHVVDILDDLVNSAVVIGIEACYQADANPDSTSLAGAGPTQFVIQADVPQLPMANREYPIALANAIANADLNGDELEISSSVNANIDWDFCTVGCTVDRDRFDFVSTLVHEVLHGMGFFTSFDPSQNDASLGTYTEPPAIMDEYVVQSATGSKIIDLPNESAELFNAFIQGSGAIVYNGPNVVAINGNQPPYIYSPTVYEQGSSMSHWDDDHATNAGRMMNAATGSGPSSRVLDAITLMVLKDIGWSINEESDYGDGALAAYGTARHINSPGIVDHMMLGATFSAEPAPAAADASDDGITQNGSWTAGNGGGSVTVNVQSTNATSRGCVSGWVDWSRDNDWNDTNEVVVAMQPVTVGAQSYTFNIPATVSNNDASTTYNGRFRLMPDWDNDGSCSDQVALDPAIGIFGGEAEDYQWLVDGGGTTTPPPAQESIYLPVTY